MHLYKYSSLAPTTIDMSRPTRPNLLRHDSNTVSIVDSQDNMLQELSSWNSKTNLIALAIDMQYDNPDRSAYDEENVDNFVLDTAEECCKMHSEVLSTTILTEGMNSCPAPF